MRDAQKRRLQGNKLKSTKCKRDRNTQRVETDEKNQLNASNSGNGWIGALTLLVSILQWLFPDCPNQAPTNYQIDQINIENLHQERPSIPIKHRTFERPPFPDVSPSERGAWQ